MSVAIEVIQPGAVFRFKTAPRRVTSLGETRGAGFEVHWEYADGQKRGGRLGGSQWVHYFKADAIAQLHGYDPSQEERQRERVARAICKACDENPDHQGDAKGNAFRWQDYLAAADAAILAY